MLKSKNFLDDTRVKIAAIAAILTAAVIMWFIAARNSNSYNFTYMFTMGASYLLLTTIPLVWLTPLSRWAFANQCRAIGLMNRSGRTPKLRYIEPYVENPRVSILHIATHGISLDQFDAKRAELEAAINCSAVKMEYGKDKRVLLLYVLPGGARLPNCLMWSDGLLPSKETVFLLGKSLLGDVVIDIDDMPHILIGGATGSGKTILMRLLLLQAQLKGMTVHIADLKGGADYHDFRGKHCTIATSAEDTLYTLNALVEELERRKELFAKVGCAKISEYNRLAATPIQRTIFACDEIAELLSKSKLSKKQNEVATEIEDALSKLACQGRAFGISLFLATQRPDANILNGQIKNNITCRICGIADNVLSQIILDNTDAATLIPKDSHGRFLLHDGTVFQGYLLPKEDEKK